MDLMSRRNEGGRLELVFSVDAERFGSGWQVHEKGADVYRNHLSASPWTPKTYGMRKVGATRDSRGLNESWIMVSESLSEDEAAAIKSREGV